MPDQIKPASRPWRRFLRFSVRGLIVAVLVIGLGLGWIVRTVQNARFQRESVGAITAAGGMVEYETESPKESATLELKTWAPAWLVKLIGIDYFCHITGVALSPRISGIALSPSIAASASSPTETDAVIAKIRRFTHLKELSLAQCPVSDAGLAHLKTLTGLVRN